MDRSVEAWWRVKDVSPPAPASLMHRSMYALGQIAGAVKMATMRFGRSVAYGYNMLLARTRFDYQHEVGDATRNSIVEAVVGWVARNFPEAPVTVVRLDGEQRITIPPGDTGAGAMLTLLERPNPWYSGVLLWMATVVDIFCTGNGYWLKVRSTSGPFRGRVVALWWLPSWMVEPAWPADSSVFISHYRYTVDGIIYEIPPEDVVHYRYGLDPYNPRKGRSRLASLFREIFTDDEAANMTASLMANLGVPGVIIAPSNTAGSTARITEPEKVKQKFMETFGGDGRGQPMVLTAATDVKVLSWSPEQMNLRELRRIPEERVSAVLGVSAIVAGLGAGLDRSTFSNYGEARAAAYDESIRPLQRLTSAELEVQLLDEFADLTGLDVEFDLSRVVALQEDWSAVWRRAESAATRGLITVQDFQRATRQPVQPGPEVYLRAVNVLEVPKDESQQAAPEAPPPGTAGANLAAIEARNEARMAALRNGHRAEVHV